MAQLEHKLPKFGDHKVKAPNCVLLWSSARLSVTSIEAKLLSKNLRIEQLDGAKSKNRDARNQLFNISHKRGQYPQIFIRDTNKQITFIGTDTDIDFLIEEGTFDEVFKYCIDTKAEAFRYTKEEAFRYKKLAQQWFDANNLFKAEKFARKSLRLDNTKEMKQLLTKIKAAQLARQKSDIAYRIDESVDMEIYDSEEKVDIPMAKHYNCTETLSNDPSTDLVNTLLEQSIALEQRAKHLESENKILKQKLSAAQEVSYVKEKNRVKGCVYECSVVTEYNSKQRSDIRISKEVVSLQSRISNKMNGHKTRLNEWAKHTQHLNTQFSKDKKDAKICLENDEKKEESSESVNVSELYLSYINCMKLLQEQQQRTEEIMTHCIDLNSETTQLRSMIKKYNISVPNTKNKYDTLCNNYDSLRTQRAELQTKVKNLVREINELIKTENERNSEKCLTLDRYNLLSLELKQYSKILTLSRKLTNKYSEFEEGVIDKSTEMNKYFREQWDRHESEWSEWDINGLICWLKYLMHTHKLRVSKAFNLKLIEEKMSEEQIKGESLSKIDKIELKMCGFTVFDDRDQTYKAIRALVEKYPMAMGGRANDSNNETPNIEKEGEQIQIPKEYLCPISHKIMTKPVIAYDNKTYEKANIIQYIEKHKRAPDCEHECDGTEPLFRNRQLKTKIEQFLWANPQIQAMQ